MTHLVIKYATVVTMQPEPVLSQPIRNCAGCGISIRFSTIVKRWTIDKPYGIEPEWHQRCPSETHEFHWPPEETK